MLFIALRDCLVRLYTVSKTKNVKTSFREHLNDTPFF